MRLPGSENNQWHWPEASAAAQVIVFGGADGDGFPIKGFYTAMAEAFDKSVQDVRLSYGKLGARCILNDVVPLHRKQLEEPEELNRVMAELGTLAGGGVDAKEAVVAASERLRGEEDAVEALKSLGSMAAKRVARPRFFNQKGWRLAV